MRWFRSGSAVVGRAVSSQDPGHTEPSPRAGSAALNLPGRGCPPVHLRPLPLAEAEALLDGTASAPPGLRWHEDSPTAETLDALAMLMSAHRAVGWAGSAAPDWWLHQIVLGDLVAGDVGFHGPPGADPPVEVEIGYSVVAGLRGRGIATQACRLILAQAWLDGAALVRAETEADNQASQHVLRRVGFAQQDGCRFRIPRPVDG